MSSDKQIIIHKGVFLLLLSSFDGWKCFVNFSTTSQHVMNLITIRLSGALHLQSMAR